MVTDDIENLIGSYRIFLEEIASGLFYLGIGLEEFLELDHLAYKTSDLNSYYRFQEKLGQFGALVSEEMISQRPIGVFKLHQPLSFRGFFIPALELMAPKPSEICPNGLDHCEFVLRESIDGFIKQHAEAVFLTHNLSRKNNPTLSLKLNKHAVKFHSKGLLEVVQIQKETGVL